MSALLPPALIPPYEPARLEALRPYQVLSTLEQDVFDEFVAVVAKLFQVPIALVSLVREADVVFVGNAGLPGVAVVAREESLCSFAILQDELTVFEDLEHAPCVLVDPQAAEKLHLRFYAGQSLHTPIGQAIGALCIVDRHARALTAAEGQLLQDLALLAEDLLKLQALKAADSSLEPSLCARLERPVSQALARIDALSEPPPAHQPTDPARAQQAFDGRLAEARALVKVMHQELKNSLETLAAVRRPARPRDSRPAGGGAAAG